MIKSLHKRDQTYVGCFPLRWKGDVEHMTSFRFQVCTSEVHVGDVGDLHQVKLVEEGLNKVTVGQDPPSLVLVPSSTKQTKSDKER